MKKIVVFSGAGLDRESGVLTFRDCKDGLWNNHKIDDVATLSAWSKNRKMVLDFYNERRRELPKVKPNQGHFDLVTLEQEYDVVHITQNVSDLLERAGASKVYHLHGELTKARGTLFFDKHDTLLGNVNEPFDIGYNDILLHDECDEGSQIRPHIVWFGEYPFHVDRAYQQIEKADILLIIGTSLQISYTLPLLTSVKSDCKIIYIDPEPVQYLDNYGLDVEYIRKNGVEGINEIVHRLIIQEIGCDKNDE